MYYAVASNVNKPQFKQHKRGHGRDRYKNTFLSGFLLGCI